MVMARTAGIDATLADAPPLRRPPLSLLDLAVPLIDIDDLNARARQAEEEKLSALAGGDVDRATQMDQWSSATMKQLADLDRWENGFTYLPELSNGEAMEIYVEGSGSTKRVDATQTGFAWYDPFEVVAHDNRSTFGLRAQSFDLRAQRAMRALLAHEAWRVEREFWTGAAVPTNYHLAADPVTPLSSPQRTIDAWPDLTPAAGSVLGTAQTLKLALAGLDQSIADADAGVGYIHATPFVVQCWAQNTLIVREQGRLLTINGNVIVPGYGYPGTGPNDTRTVTDAATASNTSLTSASAAFSYRDVGAGVAGAGIPVGTTIASVTNATTVVLSQATTATAAGVTVTITAPVSITGNRYQWAYATDTVYKCKGPARTLPYDIGSAAPEVNVQNSVDVRAERSWAMITNRLLRAAVLVDTTAP